MKKVFASLLMIALVILSIGQVFAQTNDDHNNNTIGIMAPACEKCGKAITYVNDTYMDAQVESGPHGTCTIQEEHSRVWYYDVEGWRCTNCSWSELTRGPDYGWHCVKR